MTMQAGNAGKAVIGRGDIRVTMMDERTVRIAYHPHTISGRASDIVHRTTGKGLRYASLKLHATVGERIITIGAVIRGEAYEGIKDRLAEGAAMVVNGNFTGKAKKLFEIAGIGIGVDVRLGGSGSHGA